jgi:hypothetical protein
MARSIHAAHEPTLPRELLRSAPRTVGLTHAGLIAAVFIATALPLGVAGGTAVYAIAARDADNAGMLAAEGRDTNATIVRIRRRGAQSREATLEYRYLVDGREFSGRAKLRRRDARAAQVQEGDSIRVRYIPRRPERSWAEGAVPRPLPLWVGPVVGLAVATGALPVWLTLRRQRRLLENGRAAMARVLGTKQIHHGQTHALQVDYEWTLLSGALRKGSYTTERKAATVGPFVAILYDAEQPRRRAVYPLSLVRIKEA